MAIEELAIEMWIRALSYNVHKCIGGLDRRYRPERIVTTIAHYEPDLVLLQEVDAEAARSRHDRQAEMLSEMLDLRHHAFFTNVRVRGGGGYGNAVLSRFPITTTENIDITIPPKKRRSVLHTRVRVRLEDGRHTRTLHVFNLHLGLSGFERKRQLRQFLDGHPFAGVHAQSPVLIAGDFNDVWGTLGPSLLRPAGFETAGAPLATFPAYAPMRALDAVYVRGQLSIRQVFRSRLELAREASDHLPLVVDLEILPARAAAPRSLEASAA